MIMQTPFNNVCMGVTKLLEMFPRQNLLCCLPKRALNCLVENRPKSHDTVRSKRNVFDWVLEAILFSFTP